MIIHFKLSLIYPLNMNVIILMKSLQMTYTRRSKSRSEKKKMTTDEWEIKGMKRETMMEQKQQSNPPSPTSNNFPPTPHARTHVRTLEVEMKMRNINECVSTLWSARTKNWKNVPWKAKNVIGRNVIKERYSKLKWDKENIEYLERCLKD